jgi:hypothetical protein
MEQTGRVRDKTDDRNCGIGSVAWYLICIAGFLIRDGERNAGCGNRKITTPEYMMVVDNFVLK